MPLYQIEHRMRRGWRKKTALAKKALAFVTRATSGPDNGKDAYLIWQVRQSWLEALLKRSMCG
jgi:hypothetical protein